MALAISEAIPTQWKRSRWLLGRTHLLGGSGQDKQHDSTDITKKERHDGANVFPSLIAPLRPGSEVLSLFL